MSAAAGAAPVIDRVEFVAADQPFVTNALVIGTTDWDSFQKSTRGARPVAPIVPSMPLKTSEACRLNVAVPRARSWSVICVPPAGPST